MATYPLLPLRDIVVFPTMVVPLFVGRDKSVAALEAAMEGDKDIFLLTQLEQGTDDPGRDDLYEVGVVGIPCSSFYADRTRGRHLERFAFCKSEQDIVEGLRRMEVLGR